MQELSLPFFRVRNRYRIVRKTPPNGGVNVVVIVMLWMNNSGEFKKTTSLPCCFRNRRNKTSGTRKEIYNLTVGLRNKRTQKEKNDTFFYYPDICAIINPIIIMASKMSLNQI